LYFVKNGGILTSIDVSSGRVLKTGRVTGALGGYSASPVVAEGKLYLASEDGNAAVLRAGGEWNVLSSMQIGEPIYATPALSGGEVFLRSDEALYCFRGAGK
jgi:outer membrane protein assembly factor BamB